VLDLELVGAERITLGLSPKDTKHRQGHRNPGRLGADGVVVDPEDIYIRVELHLGPKHSFEVAVQDEGRKEVVAAVAAELGGYQETHVSVDRTEGEVPPPVELDRVGRRGY
jgi:hypothetical protein